MLQTKISLKTNLKAPSKPFSSSTFVSAFVVVFILTRLAAAISFSQTEDTANNGMDEKTRLSQMRQLNRRMQPPIEIDDERVTTMGIRKLSGRHLTLYTDIRDNADIDDLCNVFDQAMPQWCKIFGVSEESVAPLKMTVMVMLEEEKFAKAGLLPDDLPRFLAGYNRGHEIWVKNQPGDYYTRHLLLHEGTHAFMQWMLGGSGPAWYSEGMAERVALHQYKIGIGRDGKPTEKRVLKINHRIKDKSEANYWGRVKIIKEDYRDDRAMTLSGVMDIDGRSFFETRPRHYAWSWAACDFLSNHPLTKESFDKLSREASDTSRRFNIRFEKQLEANRETIDRDWRTFVMEAEYGYAPERAAITEAKEKALNQYLVATDRGWQRTRLMVRKGDTIKISGQGEYEIRRTLVNGVPRPWMCQSNGVTIDYYRGRPLGMLIAGVLHESKGMGPWIAAGTESTLKIQTDGELCLRVNESPAMLDDNVGSLKVTVKK